MTEQTSLFETCVVCGTCLDNEREEFFNNASERICASCESSRFECADCEEEIINEGRFENDNGEFICKICYENYYSCEVCGNIIHSDDAYHAPDDRVYCEECFNDRYTCCYACGDTISHIDSYSAHGEAFCQECFDERFGYCEGCGGVFDNDCIYYSEEDDCDYCDSCHEQNESRSIHDYSFKPSPDYKLSPSKERQRRALYFGVELEIENRDGKVSNGDKAEEITDDNIYCKYDGSLNNGFEIVTHPFTWYWYKDTGKEYFDNLLSNLKKDGFVSYNAKTCGIHIHMSKNQFSTTHLFKFLKIFYDSANYNFIKTISQRTINSSQGSCQWGREPENQTVAQQIQKCKTKHDPNRYTAVNIQPSNTIEVRIFRGTLNAPSFHKNLQFVKSLYEYTKDESIQKVSLENYIKYIVRHRKEYTQLYQFMLKKNLIPKLEIR